MRKSGKTRQVVAGEIEWTRGQVSQYDSLNGIHKEAWKVIATAVAISATIKPKGSNEENEKVVAFSERLLRSVLKLHDDQQFELIKRFSNGGMSKPTL